MNDSHEDIQYISHAFFKSSGGSLTDAELAKLEDILIHNQAARKHYYDLAYVSAALKNTEGILSLEHLLDFDMDLWQAMAKDEKTAVGYSIEEKPSKVLVQKVVYPPREKRKISKFNLFTLITCAAAILFVIVFPKIVDPKKISVEVATLVDEINAQWADSSAPVKKGSRLWTHDGPLRLNRGVVKLRYDDGVDVLVEGPAVFKIEQSGIFLDYGRTYCRVSNSGLGFTVKTPSSKFIDLGTEFGIQADINQLTELHVIQGKVQLFAGYEKQDKLSQMITADTAVLYNANTHEIKSVPFKKHLFASQIDSKAKAVLRGYANWYEAAIAETRPVAWYRFQKGQASLGYDEISDSVTVCDFSGPITFGEGPAMDSHNGNQSLYLAGGSEKSSVFLSDRVVKRSGGKALSISLWIRPESGAGVEQNVIYYTDQKRTSAVKTNQIYLTSDNRVAFFVYNIFETDIPIPVNEWTNKARAKAQGFDVIADVPLPFKQWSHVAVCFSDKKIELYINGQLCGNKSIPVRTECYEEGYWGIGCSTGKAYNAYPDRFLSHYKGFVDEISFYDRIITAQEVQSLYDAAKSLPR
jgi:hypothetical protein